MRCDATGKKPPAHFPLCPLAGVDDDVDHRGLTPLFWTHIAPYGEVRLNMRRRLSLRDQ